MTNIITANYQCNGVSVNTDELGMREMQRRAYAQSQSQHILLKSPPASGKSRALMYIALEKLAKGLVNKVIVAVPEISIAGSFVSTPLTQSGFHADWKVDSKNDLCIPVPGGERRKTPAFKAFMESDDKVLLCTHSTLRFAFSELGADAFNDCLVAIDEFHHVSANVESKLGELFRDIMRNTDAHILAMTGSYFRGDCVPVMMPEDECRFTKVTYNYYEQLNGYQYLKSLGIGFHFYHGRYLDALSEVIDNTKKTIIHIPSRSASESLGEKYMETDSIIGILGKYRSTDSNGIISIETPDGRTLRIADIVYDDKKVRDKLMAYLRDVSKPEEVDIIVALGMAKEGFDWPFCEMMLTIGYRGSLTEIVQIIGRCTRDSENKAHAQFTNLIAQPEAESEEVITSVNDMLKAIAASLLMEEIIAPRFNFQSAEAGGDGVDIVIKGMKEARSERVRDIIDNDIIDLKAKIIQSPDVQFAFVGDIDPVIVNKALVPKVIREVYPDLSEEEVNQLGDYVVASSVLRNKPFETKGSDKFIMFAERLVNVDELDMDLIYSINPFQEAFEVLSKQLTPKVFKAVKQCIQALRIRMTDDEAVILWQKAEAFYRSTRRKPSLDSIDATERRLAEAVLYCQQVINSRKR
jgi:hypothetical protein